jgi:Transposase DDE domain
VRCCTCSRVAASGACFRKDSPNGEQYIRISLNGASPARTESAYWSGRKKKLVGEARAKQGRNCLTSFLIVDAQSVKNTDSAERKGYDAGKKVSGIKRHIAADTLGLPHATAITTAEVTDRKGALEALKRCQPNLQRVQSVLVDGGYIGQPFADGVKELLQVHSSSRQTQ